MKRLVAKTVTWRVVSTLASCAIIYAFTGSLIIVTGFGIVELVVKSLMYFGHESLWNKTQWGQEQWKKLPLLPESPDKMDRT